MADGSHQAATAPEPGPRAEWAGSTWIGADPPHLPKPSLAQSLLGALRLAAFVVTTLALLPLFFAARALGGRRDRAIAALWCGAGAWLCGLKIRQKGAPLAGGGALLVNHGTWIDILVIGSRAPVHFVAKSEVEGWPIFGWIGKISNTVFIARKRAQAKAQEQLLRARAAGGDLLCLFPEGTSSDGQRVLPFKSALFAMMLPMGDAPPLRAQPVAIRYQAPPGLPPAFHGWWGRMPLFPHILNVVRLGSGGVVTITFGEPMIAGPDADRKALAAEAEAAVRAAHAAAAAV